MLETITIDIEFEPYPGSGSSGGIPVPPAFPPSLNLLNGIATQEGALQALGLRAGNTLGAVFGNPTGGYLGAGTINLDTGIYINGVPVTGGGITIPTATLLSGNGSALGGIAVDGTSVGVSANVLSVNTGTSGSKIPFLNGANTWGAAQAFAGTTHTTLAASGAATFTAAGTAVAVTNNATVGGTLAVTGVASVGNVTQIGANNFTYQLSAGNTNLHLFKDGNGIFLLEMGGATSQIVAKVPLSLSPNTVALSGTWALSTNPSLFSQTTYTGTLSTAAGGFYTKSFQETFNLTTPANAPNGVMYVQGLAGALLNNNLYVGDFLASVSVATVCPEIHGVRSTATINANMGGVSTSLPAGIGVGIKMTGQVAAGGTWISQIMAGEVVVNNAGSVNYSYGLNIFSSSTVKALVQDVGISIWANTTAIGFGTALLFGDNGGSPFGNSGVGTLIGTATYSSGTKITGTTGIDFTNATFSGNAYQDGKTSFAGSGAIGFNGASAVAKGNITGSKTSGAAFISLLAFLVSRGDVTDSTTT